MARQFNGGNCGNCSENTPKMHFNDRSFFLAVPKPTTKNAILLKSHFSHLFNGSNSDWRREKKTSAHSRLVPSEQEQQQKSSYPLANMARKKNAFQQIHFHHSFFPIPIFISKYMNDSSVEQSRKWVAMEIKKKNTVFSLLNTKFEGLWRSLGASLALFHWLHFIGTTAKSSLWITLAEKRKKLFASTIHIRIRHFTLKMWNDNNNITQKTHSKS